ncbi:MAG: helix-turn-helix transcriptional regulator [Nocardioidaceae bacterium]|nr:helix-turn-helix transcriptional regulator [Nocardioidaceae bacterium]
MGPVVDPGDALRTQREALGTFIRAQRQLASLSLREMAEVTKVSNAYLSQLERGLHQPSVPVLRSIANALGVTTETLLAQSGLLDPKNLSVVDTEAVIRQDTRLTAEQKEALLRVYRSFVGPAPT